MKAMQQGFTLIELMIVVAIIGFLVTIAYPAYQDYIIRSKISEIMLVADAAKTGLSEYYMSANKMPNSAASANINVNISQSQYLTAINFATTENSATISYTPGNLGVAGDIALVGVTSADGIKWDCGTPATTVLDRYLPLNCRQ